MPLLELYKAESFQIKLGHMLWDCHFTACQFEELFLVWKYGPLCQSWHSELQRTEMYCVHCKSFSSYCHVTLGQMHFLVFFFTPENSTMFPTFKNLSLWRTDDQWLLYFVVVIYVFFLSLGIFFTISLKRLEYWLERGLSHQKLTTKKRREYINCVVFISFLSN